MPGAGVLPPACQNQTVQWMFNRAYDQINRRLDDQNRTASERHAEMSSQHVEVRAQIRDLSDQTRGEFAAVREAVEQRHAENRKAFWAIMAVIIGAVLASYLASHVTVSQVGSHAGGTPQSETYR